MATKETFHDDHVHRHYRGCGHVQLRHDNHLEFLHGDHLHVEDPGGGYAECGIDQVASARFCTACGTAFTGEISELVALVGVHQEICRGPSQSQGSGWTRDGSSSWLRCIDHDTAYCRVCTKPTRGDVAPVPCFNCIDEPAGGDLRACVICLRRLGGPALATADDFESRGPYGCSLVWDPETQASFVHRMGAILRHWLRGRSMEEQLNDDHPEDHHEDHDHVHQGNCGHVAILHDGHVDYIHGGHAHHAHGAGWQECRSILLAEISQTRVLGWREIADRFFCASCLEPSSGEGWYWGESGWPACWDHADPNCRWCTYYGMDHRPITRACVECGSTTRVPLARFLLDPAV